MVGIAYFFYGLEPYARAESQGTTITNHDVEFRIEKNEGFREIAGHLSQQSLIKSIAIFKLYALLTGNAQKFQPGTYVLNSSMSVPDIVRAITERGKNDVRVVIPEGFTLKDIEQVLVDEGLLVPQALTKFDFHPLISTYPYLAHVSSLEGFLFPDTYRFERGMSAGEMVQTFLSAFDKKAWPLLLGSREWYITLTLASLIEKEVPRFEDREIVAGIFLKRMKIGMPLQADATISYAKCGGQLQGCDGARIARSDVNYQSPFNTYLKTGLPPTPIGNPGIEALRAARSPKSSPYLYYLSASETKETIFSKTLEEHNRKRARFL